MPFNLPGLPGGFMGSMDAMPPSPHSMLPPTQGEPPLFVPENLAVKLLCKSSVAVPMVRMLILCKGIGSR